MEQSGERQFLAKAQALAQLGSLYRIVIILPSDTAANPTFPWFPRNLTGSCSVPIILLSGPCSIPFESLVCDAAGFLSHSAAVIRQPTYRLEICYAVRSVNGSGSIFAEITAYALSALSKLGDEDRLVIRCKTVVECEDLTRRLKMPIYYDQSPTNEKESIVGSWHGGLTGKGLIVQGALQKSLQYPHIRYLIHCGALDSLQEMDEDINYAGQDGRTAYSMTFYSSIPLIEGPAEQDHTGVTPWRGILSNPNLCVRIPRGLFWDGTAHSCAALNGAMLCGACEGLNVSLRLFALLRLTNVLQVEVRNKAPPWYKYPPNDNSSPVRAGFSQQDSCLQTPLRPRHSSGPATPFQPTDLRALNAAKSTSESPSASQTPLQPSRSSGAVTPFQRSRLQSRISTPEQSFGFTSSSASTNGNLDQRLRHYFRQPAQNDRWMNDFLSSTAPISPSTPTRHSSTTTIRKGIPLGPQTPQSRTTISSPDVRPVLPMLNRSHSPSTSICMTRSAVTSDIAVSPSPALSSAFGPGPSTSRDDISSQGIRDTSVQGLANQKANADAIRKTKMRKILAIGDKLLQRCPVGWFYGLSLCHEKHGASAFTCDSDIIRSDEYQRFKKQVKFKSDGLCYFCAFYHESPMNHPRHSMGKAKGASCTYSDILKPIAFMIWITPAIRNLVFRQVNLPAQPFANRVAFEYWLGQETGNRAALANLHELCLAFSALEESGVLPANREHDAL